MALPSFFRRRGRDVTLCPSAVLYHESDQICSLAALGRHSDG
jgi:hypothetical protein